MTLPRGALLVLIGAALLSGCGDSSTTAARQTVTVVLDWTPNTNHSGVYVAKRDGRYAQAGLEVDIIEPDQADSIAQVASGNADFAFTYAEQLLPVRARGTDVVSIATVMRTNTSSLVSPADRNITRPRDLEGKTYATFGGQIERPLIDALVRCDGGDPRKVTFVDVGNAPYSVGFRRRAYDVAWVFDGWDVIRMRDIDRRPVTTIPFRDHLDCIPDWYTPVIVASAKTIASDPELVRRFLAATAAGYTVAIHDPQAAADAIRREVPESDAALLDASARFVAPFMTDARGGWGWQDPAVWRRFNTFLRDAKLPAATDVTAAFTNAFLPPAP